MNRIWLLVVFVVLGVGILVFVYYQNQLLSKEWEKMKSAAVSETPAPAGMPSQQNVRAPRSLPRVDPANDPLAPVALKTPPPVKAAAQSEQPKKIYDFPVDGRALVQ